MNTTSKKISPQIAIVRVDWDKKEACLPYMDSVSTVEEMKLVAVDLQNRLKKRHAKRYTCHVIQEQSNERR